MAARFASDCCEIMTRKPPKQNDRSNVDRYGRTALHYAASENNMVEAQELIARSVDVNAKDDNDWTALILRRSPTRLKLLDC